MPPLRKGPDRLAAENDNRHNPDSNGGEAVEVCRGTNDRETDDLEDADGDTDQPQAQSHTDLVRVRARPHLMSMPGSVAGIGVRSSPDCPLSDPLPGTSVELPGPMWARTQRLRRGQCLRGVSE